MKKKMCEKKKFFCGLIVARTKEKKMEEKKTCRRLDELLPIFQFGSRYTKLYRDIGQG